MKIKILKFSSAFILSLLLILAVLMGYADFAVPSATSCHKGSSPDCSSIVTLEDLSIPVSASENDHVIRVNYKAKLLGFIPLKNISVDYYDDMSLYVGGFPFGVKFYTDGIMVVSVADVISENGAFCPALDAGIKINDIITKCNGTTLQSADELTSIIESSGGKPITLTYKRGENEYTAEITPVLSSEDGLYKTGMWIKDSGAGIGTVSYVLPDDYSFGGLGHGICDSGSGALMPMNRGSIMSVMLSGVKKGVVGDPGELKGYFTGEKLGAVLYNTNCGVFGIYTKKPKEATRLCSIGLKNELKNGSATVICTLDDSGPKEYDVEISAINKNAPEDSNKCFTIKITDPALIEKTGGIVQGMSGSPIIQDGKLVGAVTHVLINDPTKGYGIFIENMLSQMNG